MLKIRLQRSGRKKRPNYRVVVAEHSAPIKGRYVDIIGSFDPMIDKHGLKVDTVKIDEWIKKGAKPSNTVARLLKGSGMSGMEPFIVEMQSRSVKNPKKAEASIREDEIVDETPETPADETGSDEEKKEDETPADETGSDEEKKGDETPADETPETPADETGSDEEKKEDEAQDENPSVGEDSDEKKKTE